MLWLCGPAVKTQPSHGCYWGSIPHRVTKKEKTHILRLFLFLVFFVSQGGYCPLSAHFKERRLSSSFILICLKKDEKVKNHRFSAPTRRTLFPDLPTIAARQYHSRSRNQKRGSKIR